MNRIRNYCLVSNLHIKKYIYFTAVILAFDTYYYDQKAKTIGLSFQQWTDATPLQVFSEIIAPIADYEPGAFYKRELPCIMSLLHQIPKDPIECIVIDGFVYLDDAGQIGLGGHLYHQLSGNIPVIGVAKTNFATIENLKRKVYRGQSKNPLMVTAIGMEVDEAAKCIAQMHGEHRMPTLLKQLDGLTKQMP
jgi:exodeoxyribonuclease-5/deoxyribonuclease V